MASRWVPSYSENEDLPCMSLTSAWLIVTHYGMESSELHDMSVVTSSQLPYSSTCGAAFPQCDTCNCVVLLLSVPK